MISIEWLVDPSPGEVADVARLETEHWREILPDEPELTPEQVAVFSRTFDFRRVRVALAVEGATVVGAARLNLQDVEGREDTGGADIFVVGADQRGRGVGRVLLDAVVGATRADGRNRLVGEVATSHAGGMAFAARAGAEAGLVDEQSRLRARDIDSGLMQAWIKEALDRADGYSLVGFDGVCPDEWLPAFSRMRDVMNTAPRSEPDKDTKWTADQIRADQQALVDRGYWNWFVLVRDDSSGEFVAYSELGGSVHRKWLGQQGDTAVAIAHRGRGFGKWVKAVNALRLLRERPDIDRIETWNAGVNAPMLAINHAMGYSLVAKWQEWSLRL